MRGLLIHDDQGSVSAFVTSPTDAPPIHVAVKPGERVSEVELPDDEFDIERATGVEEIAERLQGYRVEFGRNAKLVPKQKQ